MKIPDFTEGSIVRCTEQVLDFPVGFEFHVSRVTVGHYSKRIKGPGAKGMHYFKGSVVLRPKGKSAATLFSNREQRQPSMDLIENPPGEDFPFEIVK